MDNTTNGTSDVAGNAKLEEQCLLYKLIINTVLNWILFMLGVVGNALTCLTVWKDHSKSTISILMINLAAVDTMVLLIWSNQVAVHALCEYIGGCIAYNRIRAILFRFVWPLGTMTQLMSTWSVVAITYVRFVSVCWPPGGSHVKDIRKVKVGLLAMHASCIGFSLPRLAETKVVYSETGGTTLVSNAMATSLVYKYLYLIALYYLVTYIIPLSLLVYFTLKLCLSLSEARRRRSQLLSGRAEDDAALTLSLVVVVVVFVVCQLANPLRRLLEIMYRSRSEMGCGSVYFYFSSWSTTLVIFHSACNFFIFCLCCRGFRRRLCLMCAVRGKVAPWSRSRRSGDGLRSASTQETIN